MPTQIPTRRSSYGDMFGGFGVADWGFVGLLYVFLIYVVLQTMEQFRENAGRFDFMPLINGGLFLLVGWGCVRVRRRVQTIFRELNQSSVIRFESPEEERQILNEVYRRGRLYGLMMAAAAALTMFVGVLDMYGMFAGAYVDLTSWQLVGGLNGATLGEMLFLLAVCAACAVIAGHFLGNLIANGQLLDVLRQARYELSGFSSDRGVRTLQLIESVYTFAARVTLTLCTVLGLWWVAWNVGLGVEQYGQWQVAFVALWALSLFTFVLAVLVPVRAFHVRLDEIYGGKDARALMQAQLTTARADIAELGAKIANAFGEERNRWERRRDDLAKFESSLDKRVISRRLLQPRFLMLLVVLNLLVFVVFLLVGRLLPPSPFDFAL